MQTGSYHCGLYAIAYLTELAHGHNPVKSVFEQRKMRRHLYDCFIVGVLKPFPQTTNTSINGVGVKCTEDIEVHCHCRMPEMKNIAMVECSLCYTWYHTVCEKVREECLNNNECEWYCENCIGNVCS